jgi:hypothetical protein
MDNSFPKYQISKFHNGGRDLQSVFRTNDKKEYDDMLIEWSKFAPVVTDKVPITKKPYAPFVKQQVGEICNKCGVGKIVLNPNSGKTFCDQKCWLKKDPTDSWEVPNK